MPDYFIKVDTDLEEKDWNGVSKVVLEVYESGFPARHETSVSITVSEAYDLIEQLEKKVSEIEREASNP